MTISAIFGKRMRIFRHQLNLTQEQLAEKAGFAPYFISEIERGKKRVVLETAYKIANALEVPLTELLKDLPEMSVDYTFSTPNFDTLIEYSMHIQKSLLFLRDYIQGIYRTK